LTTLPHIKNNQGFSLIEIAIVMVIIGLLAGAGLSVMRNLTQRKVRAETLDYMEGVKQAVISHAVINGRLPWADTDNDGMENTNATVGSLPYTTLNVTPTDSFKRVLGYELNSTLYTDRTTSCGSLRIWNPSSGNRPELVDTDGSSTAFSVAAVLISSGKGDADGNGNVLDRITGSPQGNNANGNPNYIRSPPLSTFDDLVVFVGGSELYMQMACNVYDLCLTGGIQVLNQTGGSLYYKQNGGSCSGSAWSNHTSLTVLPSDSYEIFSDSGCGSQFPAEPYMSFAQLKKEVDFDHDCLIGIAGGGFLDR
jgi:prepilin-type N-terminal cleavage/methylation domain-containing protein